ncbi:MAG: hypothetical protein V3U49_03735 [Nitrososphaerales archaeon]
MMERLLNAGVIEHVWNRGLPTTTLNSDPEIWRKDHCGAWIRRGEFGKHSQFGWEIGESLIPVHWQNHGSQNDKICDVTASLSSIRENTVAD